MEHTGWIKQFTHLVGCEIRSMRPILITEMLIYQSKANLDEKISYGKIAHLKPKNKESAGKGQV